MMVDEKILNTLEFDPVRKILLLYCRSALGKEVVEALVPLDSLDKARRALRQVSEMKQHITEEGKVPLQGAIDASSLIEAALENNKPIEPEDLFRVCGFLACARQVRQAFEKSVEDKPELKALISKLVDIEEVESELKRTVDPKGRILDSASPRLSDIRRKLDLLSGQIRARAEQFLTRRESTRFLQETNITFRHGRVVLPVRTECRHQVKGIFHGFSASGNTSFIEPESLVEMQNTLERKKQHEAREIAKILWERTRKLIDYIDEITTNQRIVAWIDFTYARALHALEFQLVAPELRADPGLVLRGARHPLLLDLFFQRAEGSRDEKYSAAIDQTVPFDLHLGDRFDILVVTGPNTGGKTVTLKTVGLIALMAAAGLHVPAGYGTVVPFFESVFADIGDEQDISQNLSTFSSHLNRISEIIEKAGRNSLVLLDELGTGTDPLEGEALGRGILNHLLRSGSQVLVSTHLSKLKEFAFSKPRVENACMEFNPDSLQPTFRLSIGMPGESNAIRIARRLGLPESILQEAESALRFRDKHLRELMDNVQRIRIESEQTLQQSQKDAAATQRLKEETEAHGKEIAFRRSILEQEAERQIDACLRRNRDQVLEKLRQLKNVPDPYKLKVQELELILHTMLDRSPLGVKRMQFVEGLKKGDEVYIPKYREKCRVVRVYKKEKCVGVIYKNLSIKVASEDVMWPHWF
ncbi:MAG: hypothetical protein ABIK28_19780 [Planctomycetota bacterium]